MANLKEYMTSISFSHMLFPLLIGQCVDIFPTEVLCAHPPLMIQAIKDILAIQSWLVGEMAVLYVP